MRFVVFSYAPLVHHNGQYWGYLPYIREMNIWVKHVDELVFVCPLNQGKVPADFAALASHVPVSVIQIKGFSFTSFASGCRSVVAIPGILLQIIKGCRRGDHLHLRVPGNVGLLTCLVQIFFPKKPKTAKYAGNWDPESQQPLSYQMQKWILNNTVLTRNMAVLVYGRWPADSHNIVPFFTASYGQVQARPVRHRTFSGGVKLIFVGKMTEGKRPVLACKTLGMLRQEGINASLEMIGSGPELPSLQRYARVHKLEPYITFQGELPPEVVAEKMREAHFLVFLSKSEGWPKVVAESMFWGCLPITTAVSCVPQMLGSGSRGTLVPPNAAAATAAIINWISGPEAWQSASKAAAEWSQQFTLERFEAEVVRLLHHDFRAPFVPAINLP